MKLLFVVPYIPNHLHPRPFNFLRHLSQRGHEITLLCLQTYMSERGSLEEVRPYCKEVHVFNVMLWRRIWNTFKTLPTGLPLQAVIDWHAGLARMLRKQIDASETFDILHVESIRGARYGLIRSRAVHTQRSLPVVWDSVDATGLFLQQVSSRSTRFFDRLLARLDAPRTELYEGWLVDQFDQVLVTSLQDQRWLVSQQSPGEEPAPITVLPNGVDLAYFKPVADTHRRDQLVLAGDMSLAANIVMAQFLVNEIMPLVWAQQPEARLVIAGRDPVREVRALAADPRVMVTGTVQDMRPYLHSSVISLAPLLFGLGIQNKVLEAMACATPVVATPQAIGGLNVTPGKDVVVAEDAVAFAHAVVDLMQDPPRQRSIGQAGRDYVEKHHDWPLVIDQLESMYRSLLAPAT